MERQCSLPTLQLPLESSPRLSLGGSVGSGVGTNRVGSDDAEAIGGEVSHGVGLVVYSVIVAG
jgi:hypothetical protein